MREVSFYPLYQLMRYELLQKFLYVSTCRNYNLVNIEVRMNVCSGSNSAVYVAYAIMVMGLFFIQRPYMGKWRKTQSLLECVLTITLQARKLGAFFFFCNNFLIYNQSVLQRITESSFCIQYSVQGYTRSRQLPDVFMEWEPLMYLSFNFRRILNNKHLFISCLQLLSHD